MERLPALHLVVVLLAFCCLIHASSAENSFPPALSLLQETEAIPASSGADEAAFTGEAEAGDVNGRMELQVDDYPGSGANGRHSPWGLERRN